MTAYILSRLNLWASWRLRRDDGGLGYPRKSAFAREPAAGFWMPEMESASFEMDKCVVALRFELREVVMQEFTRTGLREQKAKRCGCCLRTYIYRLDTAYINLNGLLGDLSAGVPLPQYDYNSIPTRKKRLTSIA